MTISSNRREKITYGTAILLEWGRIKARLRRSCSVGMSLTERKLHQPRSQKWEGGTKKGLGSVFSHMFRSLSRVGLWVRWAPSLRQNITQPALKVAGGIRPLGRTSLSYAEIGCPLTSNHWPQFRLPVLMSQTHSPH